ncbi:MAG: DEAD/DEAH box helicase, partial [Gemmataceae bacterium]
AKRFRYGQRLAFSGKPKWYRDHWQMNNPRVQILEGEAVGEPGVVPVYPLTEDLRPEQLRSILRQTLDRHAADLIDVLPDALRQQRDWPSCAQALRDVHFPNTMAAAQRGRRRFVYEEFLLLQLALALRRRDIRDEGHAPKLIVTPAIDARIRRLFPFTLTGDQDRAVAEVCRDLADNKPMQRLLQADVGAGKTAVAVYALLVAVANNHQAALMAPTEILARQHAQTLDRYLVHSRERLHAVGIGMVGRDNARRVFARVQQGHGQPDAGQDKQKACKATDTATKSVLHRQPFSFGASAR